MLKLNKYEKMSTTKIVKIRARFNCASASACDSSVFVLFCIRLTLTTQMSLLTGKNNSVAKIKKDKRKYVFKIYYFLTNVTQHNSVTNCCSSRQKRRTNWCAFVRLSTYLQLL